MVHKRCGVARQRFLRMELPRILATPPDALSPRIVHIVEALASDFAGSVSASKACPARSRSLPSRMLVRTPDERARHRADYLQCYGRRDRDWRWLRQGS